MNCRVDARRGAHVATGVPDEGPWSQGRPGPRTASVIAWAATPRPKVQGRGVDRVSRHFEATWSSVAMSRLERIPPRPTPDACGSETTQPSRGWWVAETVGDGARTREPDAEFIDLRRRAGWSELPAWKVRRSTSSATREGADWGGCIDMRTGCVAENRDGPPRPSSTGDGGIEASRGVADGRLRRWRGFATPAGGTSGPDQEPGLPRQSSPRIICKAPAANRACCVEIDLRTGSGWSNRRAAYLQRHLRHLRRTGAP